MAEQHEGAADSAAVRERVSAQLDAWQAALADRRPESLDGKPASPDVLGGVHQDQDGLAFTQRVFELLAMSGDPFAAAFGLRAAASELPDSLPRLDRIAVKAGGFASLGLPWAVLPVARRWLRERVAHLALAVRLPSDAKKPAQLLELHTALEQRSAEGFTTQLALYGAPVLGPAAVVKEIDRLAALAATREVTHLAIDPARLAVGSLWSLRSDADAAAVALRPVLEAARDHDVRVVFEPRDLRGALLMPEILVRALAGPGLERVRAGAMIPADLPESREITERLLRWAEDRSAEGAAAFEFTVGVARIGRVERITSVLTGLADPTLSSERAQAGQVLRLLRLICEHDTGEAAPDVIVASDDPLLLAAALEVARQGQRRLGVQLRAGVATEFAAMLAADGTVPEVRVRLPLAAKNEFASLVEPLVGLVAEAAAGSGPAGSGPAGEASAEDVWAGGTEARLAALLAELDAPFPPTQRTQLRSREWDPSERDSALFYRPPADPERFDTGGLTAAVLGLSRGASPATGELSLVTSRTELRIPSIAPSGFANEPDTDASRGENRDWVLGLIEGAAQSTAGIDSAVAAREASETIDTLIGAAVAAAEPWASLRAAERGLRLHRLALGTAAARDRLVEVLAAESGAPASVIDAQVNGAIDAARYQGVLAQRLGAVRGAAFQPDRLALVVADAGQPLLATAEAVLAVLASGSAAILLAHPSVARSSAVLIEEWEAAGLPRGAVQLAVAPAPDPALLHAGFAAELAAHPEIDRALVLGARQTALGLVQRRPDLRVEGRFQARASLLVTASADPATTVRHIVDSAFGAGVADSSRVTQLLLLGGGGWRKRLLAELADAVRGVRVGGRADPVGGTASRDIAVSDPLARAFGPLPAPPSELGLRALTELAPGEQWLVEPQRIDDDGVLWSPGVRVGVKPDAEFWDAAVGLPVIGVARVRTLAEGISMQNALGGGGHAGLLSLQPSEILPWLDRVSAASLTVGMPTTGARIERRPTGGWNAAGMGIQPLAGGPNRLVALGSWELREGTPSATLHLRGLEPEVRALIEIAQTFVNYRSFDRLRRAALADALTWRTQLGGVQDTAKLGIERNLLRHLPVPVQLRLAEGGSVSELIRVLCAGLLVRAPLTVSTGEVLPAEITAFLAAQGVPVSLERDRAWLERLTVAGPERIGDLSGGDLSVGEGSDAAIGVSRFGGDDIEQDQPVVMGRPDAAVARIRLIGGDPVRTAEWLGGLARVALWAEPVTMAGPVELLTFVREQSISITEHRFGLLAPIDGLDEWIEAAAP